MDESLRLDSIVMFNGIRNDTTDFLFKDVLTQTFAELEKKSDYCKLMLACSRDISDASASLTVNKIKGYV